MQTKHQTTYTYEKAYAAGKKFTLKLVANVVSIIPLQEQTRYPTDFL